MSGEKKNISYTTVKAVGDSWELDVLAVPFGGPVGGKDRQGEYFDERTELHLDKFTNPIVAYYHGFDPNGNPQGEPEIIGKAKEITEKGDGVWVRVILDKLSDYAKRVWEAAKEGLARASSGSIAHLARTDPDGHITNWPLVELSLFDTGEGRQPANNYAVALPVMKALYEQAGIDWPETQEEEEPEAEDKEPNGYRSKAAQKSDGDNQTETIEQEELAMDKNELLELLDAREAAKQAEIDAKEAEEAKQAALVEAALKAFDARQEEKEKKAAEEAAKAKRLPSDKNIPYITKYHELGKYDSLDAGDLAFMIGVLNSNVTGKGLPASEAAVKALALKLSEDKGEVGNVGRAAMKAAGMTFKSDEVMQQDLTSYGDEWVGVAYSSALWEKIRVGTFVLDKLPQIEVPQGYESIYLPLEGTDPTFYKVAETEDHDSTMLFPVASVTSSKMGTGRAQMNLAKMGARVPWSGEMQEDSLIPFVSQLRQQLAVSGAEQLEHAIIDGDTATATTTNINDIGDGSAQAGTELYLLFDGFRKDPLATTAANRRDGGALTTSDFLETVKLMGSGGINALDRTKVGFIMDPNTHWKALELDEVKTKDSYSQPTIEGGLLTNIWGYDNYVSNSMHYKSAARKANSSGKVDQDTTTNNTKGALLAVRWDQWKFGWRRRMTMETTRYPRSDSYEITALMRCGLVQRDHEASVITYNITV